MKIVCVLPTFKRKAITIETILQLQKQTVPMDIVVVGTEQEDIDAAMEVGVRYVQHPNFPLGAKWQAGVNVARSLGADAVYIAGSDDWQSCNWNEYFVPQLEKGVEFTGSNVGYFLRCASGHPLELYRLELYRGTSRWPEPTGQGRLFSKQFLDRVDWNIFGFNKSLVLDHPSYRLTDHRLRFIHTEGEEVWTLTIKGDWVAVNSFDVCIGTSHESRQVKYPEEWIVSHFEGGMESIRKVWKP